MLRRGKVNKQQEIALKNHCRFAFETVNPKLAFLERSFSVLLSVNSGYE